MTVDDVLRELCYVCGHSKITRGMLERLVLTERERAATVAQNATGPLPDSMAWQTYIRNAILRPPGKGGG